MKAFTFKIVETSYFSQYIGGDFEDYVNNMKRSGVWGGNIEIQAMSEMYQRPIEIYAYSATPMKTYSNENSNLTVIILFFIGLQYPLGSTKLEIDEGLVAGFLS